jgi:hypothetical protein
MTAALTSVLLTLPLIGAPAPKGAPAADALIDLLPDDTAAILVLDVPRLAKSPVGKRLVEVIQAQEKGAMVPSWFDFDLFAKDIELLVVGQYAIDQFAGDFCFLARLRDGADLAKKIEDAAQDKPFEVGKATVHSLVKNGGVYFAALDRNTIAVVLLSNSPKGDAARQELEAVFGKKRKGPSDGLKKMLKAADAEQALVIVSEHPKSANSALLAFAPFVPTGGDLNKFKGTVTRYRVGVTVGEKAEVKAVVEASSPEVAAQILATVEKGREDRTNSAWQAAMAKAVKITREKGELYVRGTLTREDLDLLWPKNTLRPKKE